MIPNKYYTYRNIDSKKTCVVPFWFIWLDQPWILVAFKIILNHRLNYYTEIWHTTVHTYTLFIILLHHDHTHISSRVKSECPIRTGKTHRHRMSMPTFHASLCKRRSRQILSGHIRNLPAMRSLCHNSHFSRTFQFALKESTHLCNSLFCSIYWSKDSFLQSRVGYSADRQCGMDCSPFEQDTSENQ